MLKDSSQTSLSFHAELYNLIPDDHILRKIHTSVDFSFIYDIVKDSYCTYYGRPANEPELLFRLLFLQTLYDLSDDAVIEDARVNLAYKWFLRLNPEDALPDPSQLSRFRNHRLGADNVDKVLNAIVKQCIDNGLIKSKSIILDSTHSLMNASKQKPIEILTKAATRLLRAVKKQHKNLYKKLPVLPKVEGESDEEQAKEMLHYLATLGEMVEEKIPDAEGSLKEKITIAKQIVEDERLLANKGIQSAIDPDARFGWKSTTKNFTGYKNHIAMTEEEIITGLTITPGNEDDGKQLKSLVEATKEQSLEIEEVFADTAYSGKDNLKYLHGEEMKAFIPLNPSVYGTREEDSFRYDKEKDQVQCPAGQWTVKKARTGKKDTGKNQSMTYYFDINLCQTCPLREGCYNGGKSKTYSISIKSEEHKRQMKFLESEDYKERKKVRLRIEHKNAEMKRAHGLTRAKYRGVFGMRIQAFLTAFTVNVKRMIKLQEAPQ
jgi:transposase